MELKHLNFDVVKYNQILKSVSFWIYFFFGKCDFLLLIFFRATGKGTFHPGDPPAMRWREWPFWLPVGKSYWRRKKWKNLAWPDWCTSGVHRARTPSTAGLGRVKVMMTHTAKAMGCSSWRDIATAVEDTSKKCHLKMCAPSDRGKNKLSICNYTLARCRRWALWSCVWVHGCVRGKMF